MTIYNLKTPWGYYLADSGEVWQGDLTAALKIRWHLAAQGLGVVEVAKGSNK